MKFNRKLSVGTLALAISLGGLTLGSQAAYAGGEHTGKTKSSKKACGGANGCGAKAKKDMKKKDAKADAKAKKGDKGATASCSGGAKSCGGGAKSCG